MSLAVTAFRAIITKYV